MQTGHGVRCPGTSSFGYETGNRSLQALLVSHSSSDCPPRVAWYQQLTEFSLHNYLRTLAEEGAPRDYIDTVRRHAKPLADNGLPVLLTLGHLAFVCGVNYRYLHSVVTRKVEPYRVFSIRKRSGGKRYIVVAQANLAVVQRWIHENILSSPAAMRIVSPSATAYVPSSNHLKNAKKHQNASWIIKVDVVRFFESISERQVYYVFRKMGYRALVAFALTRICTRALNDKKNFRARKSRWRKNIDQYGSGFALGHLPQGAATSPMLANLVCCELDRKLSSIAQRTDLTFTRYADDITMSGDLADRSEAKSVIRSIARAVGSYGFGVNHQKTNISKNGSRKIITGISVDGDRPRVPKAYKDDIRQQLYYIRKFGLAGHCSRNGVVNQLGFLLRLAGQIRYVRSVESILGEKMLSDLKLAVSELDVIEEMTAIARNRE